MVRAFEGYQLALGLSSRAVSSKAGEFDGSLDGFATAVREENPVQARELAEFLGQASLEFVVIEIGKVDGAGRLLANRFYDAGMGVAQSVDPKSGNEIQVAIPFPVEQIDSLATLEDDRIAIVGRQQKTTLAFNDFVGVGHIWGTTILSELGIERLGSESV